MTHVNICADRLLGDRVNLSATLPQRNTITPKVLLRVPGVFYASRLPLSCANPMSEEKKALSNMRTKNWAVTMWLTEGRSVETLNELAQAMPNSWALQGQIEQGTDSDDKLHAQLMLNTEFTRGTRIAKFFPNCHISEARNKFALKEYVHKDRTRVGEFKSVENRSPQWSVVCDKFFDYLVAQELPPRVDEHDENVKYHLWDKFIGLSIREGMRVDIIGVNPQYRSCINKYWSDYLWCAFARKASVDKTTDRQNDKEDVVAGGGVLSVKISKIVSPP